MINIPYGHQMIDEEDISAVCQVLKSDWLTTGPKVMEFEKAISEYIGVNHTIVLNSGTSALDVAIQALTLPPGSEIITTPFSFAATGNAILYNNLNPVFADINAETRNIDPDQIRKKITPRTKAILIVDYAGHPCEINEIRDIASENNLFLIEDACHSFGARFQGRKVGSFAADMTIFSFHPVKPITTGEGGAVVTNNPYLAEKVSLLRTHGINKNVKDMYGPGSDWAYDMFDLGRNYRMTDIQAALGISQLKKIDSFIKRRNYLAGLYCEYLQELDFIETPLMKSDILHGWHLYTILLKRHDRNRFYSFMKKHGVGVNVHYIPMYHLKYYHNNFPQDPKAFPVTENVFSRILTLPLYPGLTDESLKYVVDCVKKAGKERV